MKNLLLSVLLFLGIGSFYGQQELPASQRKTVSLSIHPEPLQVKAQPAEMSNYYGLDNKIKEITIANNIPANFPTKQGYATKSQYVAYVNEWIKVNQSLIKPEFKNTSIKD